MDADVKVLSYPLPSGGFWSGHAVVESGGRRYRVYVSVPYVSGNTFEEVRADAIRSFKRGNGVEI